MDYVQIALVSCAVLTQSIFLFVFLRTPSLEDTGVRISGGLLLVSLIAYIAYSTYQFVEVWMSQVERKPEEQQEDYVELNPYSPLQFVFIPVILFVSTRFTSWMVPAKPILTWSDWLRSALRPWYTSFWFFASAWIIPNNYWAAGLAILGIFASIWANECYKSWGRFFLTLLFTLTVGARGAGFWSYLVSLVSIGLWMITFNWGAIKAML